MKASRHIHISWSHVGLRRRASVAELGQQVDDLLLVQVHQTLARESASIRMPRIWNGPGECASAQANSDGGPGYQK